MANYHIYSSICYFLLWFRRFFLSHHRFIRLPPLISILSLMLAVASLVVALSVYSGYETTMRQTIVDMTGHLVVRHDPTLMLLKKETATIAQNGDKNEVSNPLAEAVHFKSTALSSYPQEALLLQKIQPVREHVRSYLPFLSVKSLIAYEGQLSGVLVEGMTSNKIHQVLNIKNRIQQGSFQLKNPKSAIIGRSLAKKWQLKVGDSFYVIIPAIDSSGMSKTKSQNLFVEGVIDLGFHEFNSRLVITHIDTVRQLVQNPQGVSGVRLLLKDPNQTSLIRHKLRKALGASYRVDDWQRIVKNVHENYLKAIRKEKFLIFFVLMVLVLAGAFNVSSHISIAILNQTREISILKVMGAGSLLLFSLFLLQGFFISFVGTIMGIILGWGLSKGFIGIQHIWSVLPADVYKINTIITDVKMEDLLLIFVFSQVVCILACVLPSWRALKLSIRKGLLSE